MTTNFIEFHFYGNSNPRFYFLANRALTRRGWEKVDRVTYSKLSKLTIQELRQSLPLGFRRRATRIHIWVEE